MCSAGRWPVALGAENGAVISNFRSSQNEDNPALLLTSAAGVCCCSVACLQEGGEGFNGATALVVPTGVAVRGRSVKNHDRRIARCSLDAVTTSRLLE